MVPAIIDNVLGFMKFNDIIKLMKNSLKYFLFRLQEKLRPIVLLVNQPQCLFKRPGKASMVSAYSLQPRLAVTFGSICAYVLPSLRRTKKFRRSSCHSPPVFP